MEAPDGFGVVDDFLALKVLAPDRPLKVAIPGPLTFAMPLKAGVRNRDEVMDEIVKMVRAELSALSDAGADYIQLDEPALPHPPLEPAHRGRRLREPYGGRI